VAGAPRPHLVIPRKPLFQRRGVQVTLIVVLVAGIAALVWWGLARQRNAREVAAEKEDVSSFGAFVEEALRANGVGQPYIGGYLILPELTDAVSRLVAGEGSPKGLAEQARTWSKEAREAAATIRKLQPNMRELQEARNLMGHSLELYSGLTDTFVVAVELEGKPRRDLLASLQTQLPEASAVWTTAWTHFARLAERLGVREPSPLTQSGLPGG
jgi:hypothetical protein